MDTGVSAIVEQHPSRISELGGRVVELRPKLFGKESEFRDFCRLLSKLLKVASPSWKHLALAQARAEIQNLGAIPPSTAEVALKFACSVVVDIVAQGWELSNTSHSAYLRPPAFEGVPQQETKRRIREGHLMERDAQLREPSVREFIKGMELRRLGPTGWVSIFDLMRDGQELATRLHGFSKKEFETQVQELPFTTSPYLQFVEPGAVCEFTGLKLTDIWRYFRHTWVNTYKSVPGRSMLVLVRDAAAKNHPVVGIAALGSSMVQQTIRDQWIGWDSEIFLQRLSGKPTARLGRWVLESIRRLIAGIHIADFVNDGIIERREIARPTQATIESLLREAKKAVAAHQVFPYAAEHKRNTNGNRATKVSWQRQSATSLFRAKRAKTLSLLLSIRLDLLEAGLSTPTLACLKEALGIPKGRSALQRVVRLVKAEHVGVDMMDIIVCGAVPPYNSLLGGKLVCLLLTSTEVVHWYRKRYGQQESIIASSMRGRSTVRRPNLVLLATTSLYGIGSSQYNRIRVNVADLGGLSEERLEYVELGVSKGYGSYHFSKTSIDYLNVLLGRSKGWRKVNSIFGEGVNPLMRKLRDGLTLVGLPSDALLKHGNPRVVYAVPLAKNFREILLGLQATPKYFLPAKSPKNCTKVLADYWCRRWLLPRIARPETLEEVGKHTLTYPISHGARVQLPKDDNQSELFEEGRAPRPSDLSADV